MKISKKNQEMEKYMEVERSIKRKKARLSSKISQPTEVTA